ncbi:MAG: PH domain-containing protein [Ruminococcus sp.]|nr:PH domain-containing protein [Ruminococcus sp.]
MKKDDIPYVWTDKKRTVFGLPLSFTRYFLTETKFITRKGFFNIEEDEMEIYKIDDKKLRFTFGQRLFRCGTIIIYSRDRDTPIKEVKSIKNARKVSDMIDQYLNAVRDKYGIRGRDLINCDGHENDDNY